MPQSAGPTGRERIPTTALGSPPAPPLTFTSSSLGTSDCAFLQQTLIGILLASHGPTQVLGIQPAVTSQQEKEQNLRSPTYTDTKKRVLASTSREY